MGAGSKLGRFVDRADWLGSFGGRRILRRKREFEHERWVVTGRGSCTYCQLAMKARRMGLTSWRLHAFTWLRYRMPEYIRFACTMSSSLPGWCFASARNDQLNIGCVEGGLFGVSNEQHLSPHNLVPCTVPWESLGRKGISQVSDASSCSSNSLP